MNDDRFERSLRSTLAADAPAEAPPSLHQAVEAVATGDLRPAQGTVVTRLLEHASVLGLVAAAAVVAVIAIAMTRGGGITGVGGLGAAPGIHWATPYAELTATDLSIETGSLRFVGSGPVDVHSDPGTATYRTLEASWQEQGVEMRLFIYFAADADSWWVTGMRTYDGRNPPNWAYYDGPLFLTPKGQAYRGTVDLTSNRTDSIPGHLHIDGLVLSSFGLVANASPGAAGAGMGATGASGPAGSGIPGGGPVSTQAAASAVASSRQPSPSVPGASSTASTRPSPDPADIATTKDTVTAFEQSRANGDWRAAWDLLSPWQQAQLPYRNAASSWQSFASVGGDAFTITQVTNDWTVLNYAYVGAIEANIRANADAPRALAVWITHPGINAVSAGSEGLLVAPMSDGSGWRIWLVH